MNRRIEMRRADRDASTWDRDDDDLAIVFPSLEGTYSRCIFVHFTPHRMTACQLSQLTWKNVSEVPRNPTLQPSTLLR